MIYLDHNATTPVDPEVLEVMFRVARDAYGNPGSRHAAGRRARQVLEDSREQIAATLDAAPQEVVFTSGGTEASNLALFGLTAGRTGTVILPPGEHPATEEPVKRLLHRGCRRFRLAIDERGRLVPEACESAPWDDAILATVLWAHNETGTIQKLDQLVEYSRQHKVPLHVDAVQAVGKMPVAFHASGATTMSVAPHKFGGPRGIGALLIREQAKVLPQLLGGHQEQRKRAGTESVMLAAGFAKAVELAHADLSARITYLQQMRDQLETGLRATCAPVVVNGDPKRRLPNTLNISFPGCDADALLVALDLKGICCSHGSACASGSAEPSPILLGMGCSEQVARSAIRFSIGMQNTIEEINIAIERIAETVSPLRATAELSR